MPVNDGDARLLNIVTDSTHFLSIINANPQLPATNYVFKTDITVSTNAVVPAHLTFEPQDGAMFKKSGSGTITFQGIGIAAEDISPYVQVFATQGASGFLPGDVTWGEQMPPEIWATWFGFKAGSSGYAAGNSAAMKTIEASFTKNINEGFTPPADYSKMGTKVKFPFGDFYFAEEFVWSANYSIEGVENNNHWGKGTRFFFPTTGNGVFMKQALTAPLRGRVSGNIFKHVEIKTYGAAPATVSTAFTNAGGATTATAAAGTFAFPFNNGMTLQTPTGRRLLTDRIQKVGASATTATISNNNTRLRLVGATFTSDNIGDDIWLINHYRVCRITALVSGQTDTVDVDYIENFASVPASEAGTATVTGTIPYRIYDGKRVAVHEYRMQIIPAAGSAVPTDDAGNITLDSIFIGSTMTIPGTSYSAQVSSVTPLTLSAPITQQVIDQAYLAQRRPEGNYKFAAHFTNLSGTANVQVNKFAGFKARYGEHALIENIRVAGWAGAGFLLDTFPIGNVDHMSLDRCKAEGNQSHGFHFIGTDAHAMFLKEFNSVNNGSYGIADDTGTGTNVQGGHIAYNHGTVWMRLETVNHSSYTDVYTEGGQLGARLSQSATWSAGTNASGFQLDSQGAYTLTAKAGLDERGARLGGYGFNSRTTDHEFRARFWGDSPASSRPILSGVSMPRSSQGIDYTGSDWSLYHSSQGLEIGAGHNKAENYYLAGTHLDRKAWNVRRLEIGDNTDASKTNHIGMHSAAAAPSGQGYPKGYIVWNLNPSSGGVLFWRNTGNATTANWEAVTADSGAGLETTRVKCNTSQTILTNTVTAIQFTQMLDSSGAWAIDQADSTRLVCQESGVYDCSFQSVFVANGAGEAIAFINCNTTEVFGRTATKLTEIYYPVINVPPSRLGIDVGSNIQVNMLHTRTNPLVFYAPAGEHTTSLIITKIRDL